MRVYEDDREYLKQYAHARRYKNKKMSVHELIQLIVKELKENKINIPMEG